jgi:L-rhamnose isomerase/sugar isomerase
MNSNQHQAILTALDSFAIETPSWGYANTGTRFGKFQQASAATTTEEKFQDAGQVHQFTGCCPTVAVHVLWDFPEGTASTAGLKDVASKYGVRIGAINPNVFQDQIYKHGSLGSPDPQARAAAMKHLLDCVEIQKETGSRDLSLWFADGTNFPGSSSIRQRRRWFEDGLREVHSHIAAGQRMLVEYKPFEPAFYHTDIADWGMSYLLSKAAGPQARVLVDTGHHYQAQNIEQIVAWLLADNMLGGFHFNDRRYADDDLTMGSIDPYQVFRIFYEISQFEWETGTKADIAYMIDQSHNLKNKVEEMIQTVCFAQETVAKAAIVDHPRLKQYQDKCDLVAAEESLKDAYNTDVRPVIQEWRKSKGLSPEPLKAFRESGYTEKAERARGQKNREAVSSYA